MFKTQKMIMLAVMAFLFLMMLILSVSYLGHIKASIGDKTGDRISKYWSINSGDKVNSMANLADMEAAKEQLDEMLKEPEDLNDST